MNKKIYILVVLILPLLSVSFLEAGTSRTKRALRIGSRINASTPGSLLFIDLNKKLAEDPANLVWINNQLGIGTDSPDALFHAKESTAGTSTDIAKFEGLHGNIRFFNDDRGGNLDRVVMAFENKRATQQAIMGSLVTGDTFSRLAFTGDAKIKFGSGSSGHDVDLYRNAANVLRTSDSLVVDVDIGVGVTAPAEKVEIEDGNATTIFQISNTATDGDPGWALALSGVKKWTGYCDDGDGDKFKIDVGGIGGINAVSIDSSGYVSLPATKTDTGDPSNGEGKIYVNSFDNVIKMYADGAWRTLASW